MKLEGTVVYTIIICIGIGVGLSLYQVKKTSTKKKVSLTFDTMLSSSFKDEAFAFVREQEKITTPLDVWSELLKERFAVIQHVQIRVSKKKIFIKLKAYHPIALVNNDFVLLESGVLTSRHHFIKLITKLLKSVFLTQKNMGKFHVSSECKSFIQRCNSSLCKHYSMTWHSPTHIELYDNHHKNVTVIATSDTDLSEATQQHCKYVTDTLMNEPKKKHKKWEIDIRFKNQIIVAMR